MWACLHGHHKVVKTLVEARAAVDCATMEHLCTVHNETTEFLAIASARQEKMLAAAKRNDIRGVQKAIEMDTSVDAKDEEGWTALMWAAISDCFDLVTYLVGVGADLTITNDAGLTARELAAKSKNGWHAIADYLDRLQVANANVALGARWGDFQMVKSSLEAKAYVYSKESNWTPLHWAASRGDSSICQLLLNAKASIEGKDEEGYTPLLICAPFGHVDCMNDLTRKPIKGIDEVAIMSPGADVHARTKKGEGVLELAAKAGKADVVIWWIDRLAEETGHRSWDLVWKNKKTLKDATGALMSASSLGHYDVVHAFYEREFNMTVKCDSWGWEKVTFALLLACRYGYIDIVKLLLSAKPRDMNDCDYVNRSSLYWAARNGHIAVVEMLLEAKADHTTEADDDFTVLHAAAMGGEKDMIQTLIAHGADPKARTLMDHLTPADCALQEGHVAIAKLLNAHARFQPSEGWSRYYNRKYLNLTLMLRVRFRMQSRIVGLTPPIMISSFVVWRTVRICPSLKRF